MQYKIIFSKHDLVSATGINYIYKSYLKCFKEKHDIAITTKSKFNYLDITPGGIFFLIYTIFLPILILPSFFLRSLISSKSNKKIFVVSHMHNIRNLFLNIFQDVRGIYCVDSIFNYHKLRFAQKPKYLRFIFLIPSYLCELNFVIMTECPLFFNSSEVAEEFTKRYKYFISDNREIMCLNIGHPSSRPLYKKNVNPDKNNFAIYGNFLFYESEFGLNRLIEELKNIDENSSKVHTNIHIFGKNSNQMYYKYNDLIIAGVQFSVLGMVDSIEDVLQSCDGVIIPVEKTGGLKIKLLETLNYGLYALTTQNVAKHLEGYKNFSHLKVFNDIEDIVKNLGNLDIKDPKNFIKGESLPKWETHYRLVERLFSGE